MYMHNSKDFAKTLNPEPRTNPSYVAQAAANNIYYLSYIEVAAAITSCAAVF